MADGAPPRFLFALKLKPLGAYAALHFIYTAYELFSGLPIRSFSLGNTSGNIMVLIPYLAGYPSGATRLS